MSKTKTPKMTPAALEALYCYCLGCCYSAPAAGRKVIEALGYIDPDDDRLLSPAGAAAAETLGMAQLAEPLGSYPDPTADQLEEAARLRAQATRNRASAEESFQRCDTDGFLSQWADGINARLREREASILECGGWSVFWGLYEGDRRVNAKRISIPAFRGYGTQDVWLLSDVESHRFNRRYIPSGLTSRVQRSLGLRERREWAPARAAIGGGGRGLSGCASAHVVTYRTDYDNWSPNDRPRIAPDPCGGVDLGPGA